MKTDVSFGRWLKHRRLDLNLTQAELAGRISYSTVTIRKIESEDLRPSRQIAEKLAEQLELDPGRRADFIRFARGEAGGSYSSRPASLIRQANPCPTCRYRQRRSWAGSARR